MLFSTACQDPIIPDNGPQCAAAFSLWLYSALWAWYIQTYGVKRSWIPMSWYAAKCAPSFFYALGSLRSVLWRQRVFSTSENPRHPDSRPCSRRVMAVEFSAKVHLNNDLFFTQKTIILFIECNIRGIGLNIN